MPPFFLNAAFRAIFKKTNNYRNKLENSLDIANGTNYNDNVNILHAVQIYVMHVINRKLSDSGVTVYAHTAVAHSIEL